MKAAPLKKFFFLAVLKLDVRIPLNTTKKLKGWEKPPLQHKLIICTNITKHVFLSKLKNKKANVMMLFYMDSIY